MRDAVVVENVYKKFGKPGDSIWGLRLKKLPLLGSKNSKHKKDSSNGNNLPGDKTIDQSQNIVDDRSNGDAKFIIAVDHITFHVREGEIFGVLGPNGGGKSTLIRLMSTLLLPDSGRITIFGYDVVAQPYQVQKMINRVSVDASFFKKLSPMENLIYGARLYGLDGADIRKQVVEILTRLGLEKRAIYHPMEEMSRGMQQKVAIARALLTHPRLLLLDEPTTGLDPRSKRDVQAVVQDLRDKYGTTVILTTHDMVEAETLCDRIAIMDSGKVVALDTPEELKELVEGNDGKSPTLEDVFLELTGKKLVTQEVEE